MNINEKKKADLDFMYSEICKELAHNTPLLEISINDGVGFIKAINHTYQFLDYEIQANGQLHVKHCAPVFHGFVTEENHPFEVISSL